MTDSSRGRAAADDTRYIVYDTESVVDGALLSRTRYPGETLTPAQAIERFRADRVEDGGDDFIPVSYHVPVAIGIARVGADFRLRSLTALDAPRYDPREMAALFWRGVEHYRNASLVDFNGRGFDIPLLTLAALRFGIAAPRYFGGADRYGFRYRFSDKHLDLMDWLTEYGAFRLHGGLNVLAKMLGKPGKMDVSGDQVYGLWKEGRLQEINDYCICDTLDTYFVFLRMMVLRGELSGADEADRTKKARELIEAKAIDHPGLKIYLDNWGDGVPWP